MGDFLSHAGGNAAGIISGLLSLRGGQLQNYIANRAKLLGDPTVRAQLEQSPFLRGLLFVGSTTTPEQGAQFQLPEGLGPAGGQPIAAPTGRTIRTLDLPPLDPATAVKQAEAIGRARVLTSRPDAADIAAQTHYGVPAPGFSINDYPAGTPIPREPGTRVTVDQYGRMTRTIGDEPAPIQFPYGSNAPVDASGRVAGRQYIITPPATENIPQGARVLTPGGIPGGEFGGGPSPIPNKNVVVTPSPGSQSIRTQLSRIRSARAGFREVLAPLTDPKGQPLTGPNGQPVTALDVLPGGALANIPGGMAGAAFSELPYVPGARVRMLSKGSSDPTTASAAAQLNSLIGQRANLVKALGDVGNLAEQEQKVVSDAFIPGGNDTYQSALYKSKAFDGLMAQVETALDAASKGDATVTPDDLKALILGAAERAGMGGGAAGTSTPSTPTPEPSRTLTPRELGGGTILRGKAARDYLTQ